MLSDDALTDLLLAEMVESGELVKVTDADGETRYRIGPSTVACETCGAPVTADGCVNWRDCE